MFLFIPMLSEYVYHYCEEEQISAHFLRFFFGTVCFLLPFSLTKMNTDAPDEDRGEEEEATRKKEALGKSTIRKRQCVFMLIF